MNSLFYLSELKKKTKRWRECFNYLLKKKIQFLQAIQEKMLTKLETFTMRCSTN